MPYFMCSVNGASILSTAVPQVVLTLTDLPSPSTSGQEFPDGAVFIASDPTKEEVLAVALTAISTQRPVWVEADQPNFNEDRTQLGFAQCYNIGVVVDYLSPPWLLD